MRPSYPLYTPYYHVPVRRATISLSLLLTILISSVRLKTVYPQTILIRYLTIVRLGNRYLTRREL
ncbi:hypothetical protein PNI0008_01635 [Streptococcus pneumoniae PNI0008]|nr:hypothetical protein PNI0008_01635 [Streptococcus pneumoniae PNI0008]